MRALNSFALSVLVASGAAGVAQADVLIDIAPPSSNASNVALTQANAVGFSLAAGYTDVMIEASLVSATAGNSGTAWLTTAVGAGTTAADVVATTTFNFAQVGNVSADVSFVELFSGLSLSAGSYFLVVGPPVTGAGAISINPSASYVLDPNASIDGMLFSAGTNLNPAFTPSSTFLASGLGNRFFRVEGVIPAPASVAMLGFGGLAMARRRR